MKPAAWTLASLLATSTLLTSPASARAVQAPEKTVAQKAAGVADKTKDAVIDVSKTVVNKTKDGLSKTGEVMTDAWITTRVHARFVDEALLKDSDIKVDSADHIVTLRGTVKSRAGRTRAGVVALGTEGVRKIVNRLTIGAKKS